MKQAYFLPLILGVVLLISYQNCSKTAFQSTVDSQSEITDTSKNEQPLDVGTRVPNTGKLGENAIVCPMIMCAAPPENCHYEQDITTDVSTQRDHRCSSSCGRLVCDSEEKEICPMIKCQAPPEGCKYADKTEKGDPNTCPSCGNIVCEQAPPSEEVPPIKEPISCPLYKCVAPPEGCHLAAITKKDENGCNIGCGEVVCPGDATEINPTNIIPIKKPKEPIICPMYMCAAPPNSIKDQSCEYSGSPAVDKDGCPIGCGIVACFEDK